MRERLLAAVVATVALGAATSPAAALPRQTGSFRFTNDTPGRPTGNTLHVVFHNPAGDELKPYAVYQMIVHVPKGTITDTSWLPQCHASDAEIYSQGPGACPPGSRIGSGWAKSDTGGSGSSRYNRTTLTHFNNQDEVVGIGVNDQTPAIKTIDRTKIERRRTVSTFPAFPGTPPPEPYTPVRELYIHFPVHKRRGRAYTRTPPTCPRIGHWTFRVDFVYRDGKTRTLVSKSPCVHRKRPQAPR